MKLEDLPYVIIILIFVVIFGTLIAFGIGGSAAEKAPKQTEVVKTIEMPEGKCKLISTFSENWAKKYIHNKVWECDDGVSARTLDSLYRSEELK